MRTEVEQLRHDLTMLRVSVARVAQALGVNGSEAGDCPRVPLGLSYGGLCILAETQERGWNSLCYWMVQRAQDLQDERLDFTEEFNK